MDQRGCRWVVPAPLECGDQQQVELVGCRRLFVEVAPQPIDPRPQRGEEQPVLAAESLIEAAAVES